MLCRVIIVDKAAKSALALPKITVSPFPLSKDFEKFNHNRQEYSDVTAHNNRRHGTQQLQKIDNLNRFILNIVTLSVGTYHLIFHQPWLSPPVSFLVAQLRYLC